MQCFSTAGASQAAQTPLRCARSQGFLPSFWGGPGTADFAAFARTGEAVLPGVLDSACVAENVAAVVAALSSAAWQSIDRNELLGGHTAA